MAKCEADGCQVSQSNLPPNVELLRFPDDFRLPVWIECAKGVGATWTPKPNSRLCTIHFENRFFYRGNRLAHLLKGAMPTLNLGRNQIRQSPVPSISSVSAASSISLNSSGSPTSAGATQHRQRSSTSIKKSLKDQLKPGPKANSSEIKAVLQRLNNDGEDDYLNKILLNRTVKGLIIHIDELVQHHDLESSQESDLMSMSCILQKVQKNMSLSPDEALDVFQKQIPEKIYNSLRRLIRHDKQLSKRQYKSLVRAFALTLHFFSIPVYSYVRKMSQGELPHPRTIQAWYTTIDKYMY